MLTTMVGIVRKGPGWPDRLPPPPRARQGDPACARCGEPVSPDERDAGEPVRHLVCDTQVRAALLQRIEASRAVHRAAAALAAVPAVQAKLTADIAALPDACDVGDALAFLARARVVIECSSELSPQQRRVAISFVDATVRKLGG
ncbi:Hypothetical protein I5071_79970 [Sandaracinus amylolyticus]|nr:Hypothetical protein I5071_79970 [Sandaracinus amylolyticus]